MSRSKNVMRVRFADFFHDVCSQNNASLSKGGLFFVSLAPVELLHDNDLPQPLHNCIHCVMPLTSHSSCPIERLGSVSCSLHNKRLILSMRCAARRSSCKAFSGHKNNKHEVPCKYSFVSITDAPSKGYMIRKPFRQSFWQQFWGVCTGTGNLALKIKMIDFPN